MSDHVLDNNPKKEVLFALGGVVLFLGLVLIIGISAFLRPAGEHITAEPTAESVAADEAAVIAAAPAAAPAPVAEVATDGAAATTVPADATVTPAPDTGDAIVATGSAAATADGVVDQAAVADADLTAEQADGDTDAGAVKPATAPAQ